jgi:hypothetical protein
MVLFQLTTVLTNVYDPNACDCPCFRLLNNVTCVIFLLIKAWRVRSAEHVNVVL